jgi:branched-chain amino acid transport system substrate-binding protein
MKRHATLAMLLCIVLSGVLTACGSSGGSKHSSKSASSGPPPIPKGPITIGAPLALTGALNFADGPQLQGIQLAISDINAKGGVLGHKLKLITADTKSDPPTIATAAQSVIDKGAQFMIPTMDYDFGGPAARVAMAHKMIAVTTSGDPRMGLQGIGPYMFNVYPGSPTEGATAAAFAYNFKHWRSVYVLTDETISHAKTVCPAFEKTFKELGGTISGDDTFQGTDQSIATQVTRMRAAASKTDAIMECSLSTGGISALRQIRGGGITQPIILDNAYDGTYWLSALPPKPGQIYVVSLGAVTPGQSQSPLQDHILKSILAKSGKPVSFGVGAFTGYSAVQTIAMGITETKTLDSATIKARLEKFTNVPLAAGSITWTPTCHLPVGKPMQMLQIVNGAEKYLTTITPTNTPKSVC